MANGKPKLKDYSTFLLQFGSAALLIIFHGWDKLVAAIDYVFKGASWGFVNVVDGLGFPLPGLFAVIVALIESIVAFLFAVGIMTRVTAGLLTVNFLFALIFHISTGTHFELAGVYFIIFLYFTLYGPGVISTNIQLKKKEGNR